MLQMTSQHGIEGIETAVRQAAQRHGVNVLAITHLGPLLRKIELVTVDDPLVFTVCQPDISAALLSADRRFAAFLPCRVAAWSEGGAVRLEALSPVAACQFLERPDLEGLARPLETILRVIMEEAVMPPRAAHALSSLRHGDVGATEEQMHPRGMVPQRIDCHGTKVEELAGTGEHDSSGG